MNYYYMTHLIKCRRHVLRIKEQECLSFSRVAERFSVGLASVKRWSKRVEPKQHQRKKLRKIDRDLKKLAQDVEKYPDAYQYERADRFDVCSKAIWQALKKLKITYKKSHAAPQGKRRRPPVLSREVSGP